MRKGHAGSNQKSTFARLSVMPFAMCSPLIR